MAQLNTTQRYNKVVTAIALKRHGIKANTINQLKKKDWKKLTELAGGDENFAHQCVVGYFDGTGSDNVRD